MEQIVDVPVPPATAQGHISECIVEQVIDVSVPPFPEQTVEAVKLDPQERLQQRTVEQTVDVPVVTHGQVPQVQYTDRIAVAPVAWQHQALTIQTSRLRSLALVGGTVDSEALHGKFPVWSLPRSERQTRCRRIRKETMGGSPGLHAGKLTHSDGQASEGETRQSLITWRWSSRRFSN